MSSLLRCGRLQSADDAIDTNQNGSNSQPGCRPQQPTFCAASRTSLSTKRWPRGMTNAPALFLVDSCGRGAQGEELTPQGSWVGCQVGVRGKLHWNQGGRGQLVGVHEPASSYTPSSRGCMPQVRQHAC